MTRTARRAAGLAVAATIVLAACGASATPAPSSAPASGAPASTEPASAAATNTPPATTTPAEPTASAAEATPATPSDDRPLEERLPTSYGGVTLQKMSLSGEGAIDQATASLLEKHGKTAADVSSASAFGGGDVIFIATRVKGLGEAALRELMVASAGLGVVELQVEEVSLDGQTVYKTTVPGSETHGYFIVRGDTAFGVTAATDDVAARALAAIP